MFHVKHFYNVNFAYYNLIVDIIEIMSYNRLDIKKGGHEREVTQQQVKKHHEIKERKMNYEHY